jgi:hypothetical protein
VVCVQEPISAVCIFQESLVASASQDSSVKLYNIKATLQTLSKILQIYYYRYTSSVANPGFRFFHPGSRVKKASDPDSGYATKNSSIFNKKLLQSSRKYDPGSLSQTQG